MAIKLTDALVRNFNAPDRGNRIMYDTEVTGFGCRVTATGSRSFVLNYRTKAGRQRRYTIGSFPEWKASAARQEAASLKRRIDVGEDPLANVEAVRTAPMMTDLLNRYGNEYLADVLAKIEGRPVPAGSAASRSSIRLSTQAGYESHIRNYIRP
ncbi:MAG TPA: Arm DNA-binding domain-containing protein, partial [Tianweitania sediminis]|nr:Arm DNA-binding domain-containing protein [Tianweitania sediminis]